MVTYQCDLFDNMNTVDVLITILGEGAVGHHGVLGALVLIVNTDDHRVVVFDALCELKGSQIVDIESNLTLRHSLVDTGTHSHVMDVVLTVGCVEHLWSVVGVLLFSDTEVDTDMGITESVVLEGDVQILINDFLKSIRRE